MKGFVIESGAAFRPDGPPAMDSERFARAGMSRIYGGIHFRYSNEDGLALGRKVARAVASGFD